MKDTLLRFLREEDGMTRTGKILLVCTVLGLVAAVLVAAGMMTFMNQKP